MSDSSHQSKAANSMNDIRAQILHLLEHFEHVLPAQAPIKDFVHHNTLHGYQHLSFPEALSQAKATTGAKGYLSNEQFRELFAQGRITLENLEQVLSEQSELPLDDIVYEQNNETVICSKDIILSTLLYSLKPITNCQLTWQIEELAALESFQSDLDSDKRHKLLDSPMAITMKKKPFLLSGRLF
jgi:uncharacterized protein YbcC (UPF0753/DUF2309 family)